VRKETLTRRQSKRQSMATMRATMTPTDDDRARTPYNRRTGRLWTLVCGLVSLSYFGWTAVGSPDDDAFGFGMDPKGPTIAKQSYYYRRPSSRATDDTFLSTLQGSASKVSWVWDVFPRV
jgi:hypothetical protein